MIFGPRCGSGWLSVGSWSCSNGLKESAVMLSYLCVKVPFGLKITAVIYKKCPVFILGGFVCLFNPQQQVVHSR